MLRRFPAAVAATLAVPAQNERIKRRELNVKASQAKRAVLSGALYQANGVENVQITHRGNVFDAQFVHPTGGPTNETVTLHGNVVDVVAHNPHVPFGDKFATLVTVDFGDGQMETRARVVWCGSVPRIIRATVEAAVERGSLQAWDNFAVSLAPVERKKSNFLLRLLTVGTLLIPLFFLWR